MRETSASKTSKSAVLEGKPYKHWTPELSDSSDILTLDPDRVWQKFGISGRYQLLNLTMVCAPSMIYSSLMMVMPFLLEETHDFTCVVDSLMADHYQVLDQCTAVDLSSGKNVSCVELLSTATRFEYGGSKDYTITNYFDLVCENSDMREHGSAFFLFGSMFGSVVLSILSDKLGRRRSFLLSLFIAVVLNCVTAMPIPFPYFVFIALRFLAGFGHGGNLNIGYTMASEVVAPEMREYTPLVATFVWVFGYMLAGVARMYINSWRWVYFTCTFPGIVMLIVYYKCFPESLHWQVSNRKEEAILKHVQEAAYINKKTINLQDCLTERIVSPERQEASRNIFCLIIRSPVLIYHFTLASLLMIVMNCTYWALSLFSTELSPHKMTGFFLSGIIEFPAAILAVVLLKMMKRRPVSCLMFLLTALSLAIAVFVPPYLSEEGQSVVTMFFPLLAKMFNSICWNVLPLAMSEMIPTVIRNSFSGGVSFIGDVGSVTSPYLEQLNKFGKNTASITIAIATGICALGVMTMPETKGVHLSSGMESFDEGPFLRTIRRTFSSKLNMEIPISKDEQEIPILNGCNGSASKNNEESAETDDKRATFFQ